MYSLKSSVYYAAIYNTLCSVGLLMQLHIFQWEFSKVLPSGWLRASSSIHHMDWDCIYVCLNTFKRNQYRGHLLCNGASICWVRCLFQIQNPRNSELKISKSILLVRIITIISHLCTVVWWMESGMNEWIHEWIKEFNTKLLFVHNELTVTV